MDERRLVEVRLIVIVAVNITDESFRDALVECTGRPASPVNIVSSEIESNLESVPYVASVIVCPL